MFSKIAVALAAVSFVSAQTSTECNPLKITCPANPAFGKKGASCDFTAGAACDAFHAMAGTAITYDARGAIAQMTGTGQAPTLRSDNYLFFGRVEVEMQAAAGNGIVTSIVLLSDDLDEIDFETVGSDNERIQSNYFSKGDDSVFDRGGFHAVSNPLSAVHKYTFEWTPDKVEWLINGASVRVLRKSDVGDGFPQSPMQVKLGAWVAGYKGNSPGTIEWAGGVADFTGGPSTAIYKSVTIVDYAGGSSATDKDVKEYVYGDHSGSAESIQIKLKDGSETSAAGAASTGSLSASPSSPSSTSKSSSTKSSTPNAKTSTAEATAVESVSTSSNSTSAVTTASRTTANATTSITTTSASGSGTAPPVVNTPSGAAPGASAAVGVVALFLAALAI